MTKEQGILQGVFSEVYSKRYWPGPHPSGPGSTLEATRQLRNYLSGYLRNNAGDVTEVLFAGCGVWEWQMRINFGGLYRVVGVDIVPKVIQENKRLFGAKTTYLFDFRCLDITKDALPVHAKCVIFCKDVFQHLNNILVSKALAQFSLTSAHTLITSSDSHPLPPTNESRTWVGVGYCPENLMLEPFNLEPPFDVVKLDEKWYYFWKLR